MQFRHFNAKIKLLLNYVLLFFMVQNNRPSRLTFSFILSFCIHAGIIFFLCYGAWQTIKSLNAEQQGKAIEATMVDQQMTEHYLSQQSEQKKRLEAVKKQQKLQEDNYQRALQEAREQEQKRLKTLEKERKQAELDQKKLLEEQQKAKVEMQKVQIEAQKLQAKLEADKKTAQELKQKEAQDLKNKLAAEKKAQAQTSQEIDSLLDNILSSNTEVASSKMKGDVDTKEYVSLMTQAIRTRFYNPNDIYSGKSCELQIKLDENGTILSLSAMSGDPKLCAEAKKAAQSAKLPKPTAKEYQKVKDIIINFELN